MADLPGAALVYCGAYLRIAVGRPGETAVLPRQGPLGHRYNPDFRGQYGTVQCAAIGSCLRYPAIAAALSPLLMHGLRP
jgi:hypothetical protein